jgi:hypothetical protein
VISDTRPTSFADGRRGLNNQVDADHVREHRVLVGAQVVLHLLALSANMVRETTRLAIMLHGLHDRDHGQRRTKIVAG